MKEILILVGTVIFISLSAQRSLDSVPQMSKEEVMELSGISDSMFNNLVAYWPFNENSDEIVYDYSTNELNGANHSAKRTTSFKGGYALKFDGIDAVAIDSLDHRGYINGEEFEKSYNARTTSYHHAFFATVPDENLDVFLIVYGRFSGRAFSHFNGAIDDLMIFNRALHSDEIKQIYTKNIFDK